MNDDENQMLCSLAKSMHCLASGDDAGLADELPKLHQRIGSFLQPGRKAASLGGALAGRIMATAANAGAPEGAKPLGS
jgi:hypothetical protein